LEGGFYECEQTADGATLVAQPGGTGGQAINNNCSKRTQKMRRNWLQKVTPGNLGGA